MYHVTLVPKALSYGWPRLHPSNQYCCRLNQLCVMTKICEWIGPAYSANLWHKHTMQQGKVTLKLVPGLLAARRFAAWLPFAVSELQLSAATLLWLFHRGTSLSSWMEFNCPAICHCEPKQQGYRLIVLLLGLPSKASGECVVVQISPSKWQCSEKQASLKSALLWYK